MNATTATVLSSSTQSGDGWLEFLFLIAWVVTFLFVVGAITASVLALAARRERTRLARTVVRQVPIGRCMAGHEARRDDLRWMGYELGFRCSVHRPPMT